MIVIPAAVVVAPEVEEAAAVGEAAVHYPRHHHAMDRLREEPLEVELLLALEEAVVVEAEYPMPQLLGRPLVQGKDGGIKISLT